MAKKEEKVKLKPIHEVCIVDDLRPNLALIQIKNGVATATNGSILIKIQLDNMRFVKSDNNKPEANKEFIAQLEGKYIHRNVWKEMCNCDYIEIDDQFIYVYRDGIRKIFEWAEPNGEFFNINDIVIDIKEAGGEAKKIVTYDIDYLSTIASVFETSMLHMSFSKDNKGTLVYPNEHDGMFAVIMPINSDGVNRYCFI